VDYCIILTGAQDANAHFRRYRVSYRKRVPFAQVYPRSPVYQGPKNVGGWEILGLKVQAEGPEPEGAHAFTQPYYPPHAFLNAHPPHMLEHRPFKRHSSFSNIASAKPLITDLLSTTFTYTPEPDETIPIPEFKERQAAIGMSAEELWSFARRQAPRLGRKLR
jgi:hypothetical protein